MKRGIFVITLAFSAPGIGHASAQVPSRIDIALAGVHAPESGASGRSPLAGPALARRFTRTDSSSADHRRATLMGGLIGGLVGGLAATAYVLNATAYRCTTVGSTCPNDSRTTRRAVTITAGSLGGAALGALIGHMFARR